MIRLVAGYATDAGRVRANNQDRAVIAEGHLYGVADGMGGHRGGEVAAEMVSQGLGQFVARFAASAPSTVPTLTTELITDEIANLNQSLLERASDDDDLFGMGTTLTAVALSRSTTSVGEEVVVSVFNIGDSRTYLLRNGELQQLTEDHSVVGDLVRSGRITAEEAKTHRQRSVVTRALGVDATVEIDVLEVLPAPGMRYLMCSDGLTNEVPDELIGSILRRLASPAEAARELVRLAVERGGRDNVTVVVVDVVDDAGYDQAALAASWDIDAAVVGTHTSSSDASGESEPPSGETPRSMSPSPSPTPVSVTPATPAAAALPAKVRKPFPINLRVLAFLAVLAALVAIAYAVIKAAPDVEDPNSTVVVVATEAGTTAVDVSTPTTTPQSPTGSSSEELTVAPTVAAITTTTSAAQSTTTFDGFTETTIKAAPTTKKKR